VTPGSEASQQGRDNEFDRARNDRGHEVTIRSTGGLAAAFMLAANVALCSQAASAELPIPAKQAAQPVRPMGRTCIGTDGKAFRWDQPNAPFAAVCSFDSNGPAPAPSAPLPPSK
jgi:hypothetical protein